MNPFPASLLAGLGAAAIAQLVLPCAKQIYTNRKGEPETQQAGLGLALGLVVSTAIAAYFQADLAHDSGLHEGRRFWPIIIAAIPVMVTALMSDFGRPRSERHGVGLVASAVALFSVGLPITVFTNPASGTIGLPVVMQLLITTFWLFLLSSMVELVSLIPRGAAVFSAAIAGVVWLSGGEQQTVASYCLAGLVVGCVVGRELADLLRGRRVPYGKTEVFLLGVWLTATTNIAFLKSVTLVGFVLPLSALCIAVIVICIRAFERTLLLRETPRAE